MGTFLILLSLLNPPGAQVTTAAESRPPNLEPTFTNLLPDLAVRTRPRERYAARSEPVLGYVQRRLCAGDPDAQALWIEAAVEDPRLWQRLPWCPTACAWARKSGQADACACMPMFFGCGNDPRNHDACLSRVANVEACLPRTEAAQRSATAELEACAANTTNTYQRAAVVEQLVRLKGWPAKMDLVGNAMTPAEIAFTTLLAKANDGPSFERLMREAKHLAPKAPQREHSHPSSTLLAFWIQYGQAIRQSACGTMDAGPHCEPDTTNRLARTTVGALKGAVFRDIRQDGGAIRFEAWTPKKVWRIDVERPADWLSARLRLVNAVLAHRQSWGRLYQAWMWTYYASKTGLAEAERSGLLE
ncbi:MAG: hypothetical protein ACI9U2_003986 [Bradymonadia bacterium]|jgi:hypothetical protein